MATEDSDKSASPDNSGNLDNSDKQEGSERSEKSGSAPSAPPPGPARGNSGTAPARRPQAITIPPPGLDELEETYSQRTDITVAPDKTIDDQIAELEAWAKLTVRVGRAENIRLWALRITSFFAAIGAAAAAAMSMTNEAIAFGCIAAFAIAIEAGWPSTGDRAARRRATHDLRELQHALKLRWDKVRLAHPNPLSPKRVAHALVLLDAISAKREEIGKYLGDASPGVSKSVGN